MRTAQKGLGITKRPGTGARGASSTGHVREHFHDHLRRSSAPSGSFGHRTLLRESSNDQRSLASSEEYAYGGARSKSGPEQPITRPGAG